MINYNLNFQYLVYSEEALDFGTYCSSEWRNQSLSRAIKVCRGRRGHPAAKKTAKPWPLSPHPSGVITPLG